jgi:hypothetical protein
VNNAITPTTLTVDMEMVLVGGVGYIRFTRLPENVTTYPTTWVTLDEASQIPGLDAFNLDSLIQTSTSPVPLYALDETTVLDIAETEESTENLRMIRLRINASAALGDMIKTLIASPDVDPAFIDRLLENAVTDVTYAINANGEITSVTSTVSINLAVEAGLVGDEPFTLTQTSTTTFELSGFNSDIQISVPENEPESTDDTTTESDGETEGETEGEASAS